MRPFCYYVAWYQWRTCKVQCYIDYPEYNTDCDRM